MIEASIARDATRVEAVHGDIDSALSLYGRAMGLQHRSGNLANLAFTLASLEVFVDRLGRTDAAVLCGCSAKMSASTRREPHHLRAALDDVACDRHAAAGAAMEVGEVVAHARIQIRRVREESAASADGQRPDQSGIGRSVVIIE